ncbi:FAD-dependent oxidoreductase [Haliea sp. E17]|uniref:FAD-dependent oxidoreductase n=1 Tax=Haliea sp. E17 TaxID=3401576 RepID=UPI003AAF3492
MNETFDFVVVGSGGGAFSAALAMRAAGKSVVILEKLDKVGGTTAVSGGVMWIPNNRYMREAGVSDSRAQAIEYMDAVIEDGEDTPGTSHERRVKYVDSSVEMLEFLVSQGLRFRRVPSWPDYYPGPGESVPGRTVVSELFDLNQLGEWKERLQPGFLPLAAYLEEAMQLANMKRNWAGKKALFTVLGRTIGNRLRGRNLATAGQALQGQMLHKALAAGVDVRTGAGVQELVEENGRVTGVKISKDGKDWLIGATLGVLVNAGGFSRNQQLRDQYIPETSAEWTLTAAGDTGEMLLEGQRHGAALAQMDQRIGNPMTFLPDGKPAIVHGDMAKPHSIVVDQNAQRYMSEAASYVEVGKSILSHQANAPAIPSWLVFDSQFIDTYMLAGSMPGSKKPKEWTESGFLKSAASIEELAAQCELDPAALAATVDRFNGFAKAGKDEDFGRGSHVYHGWLGDPLNEQAPTLGAVEQGPFYAIKVYPGDVSTFGGMLTDCDARVLREDGSVIEGLYATGTSTASVMGKNAPGAGASIGPSVTWGYVAAQHALAAAP